jgi:ribulose kinase
MPGVLMFNVSMKVLWADRRAWDLLRAINQHDKGKNPGARIPKAIKEIGEKALAVLKAIANELSLKQQTVKEQLQRIMAKTKSASRTGILARVLFL